MSERKLTLKLNQFMPINPSSEAAQLAAKNIWWALHKQKRWNFLGQGALREINFIRGEFETVHNFNEFVIAVNDLKIFATEYGVAIE